MAKAALTYNRSWYTPVQIRSTMRAGSKDVRKEYTRLRDIAQKRLKRMAAAGYGNTQMFKMNINKFPKLKDIGSPEELAQRLSELSRFVMAKESTISGMKSANQKRLDTLLEHGDDFVTKENLMDFGEFMEEYRLQALDMEYDSGDAAEVFSMLEKHEISLDDVREDFEYWLENKEALEELRRTKASVGDVIKIKDRVNRKLRERRKR